MEKDLRALRRERRLGLVLPARCRSRSGFVDRVVITDISTGGCRIESFALTLREGDLVVISPGVIEGQCGKVTWTKGHKAGIAFLQPLYTPVVEHLHRQHAQFVAEQPAMRSYPSRLAA